MLVDGLHRHADDLHAMDNRPTCRSSSRRRGYTIRRATCISYRYIIRETLRSREQRIDHHAAGMEGSDARSARIDLKNLKTEVRRSSSSIFNDGMEQQLGVRARITLEEFLSVADGLKYVMPAGRRLHRSNSTARRRRSASCLPNLHEILADHERQAVSIQPSERSCHACARTISNRAVCMLFGIRKALQRKAIGGVITLAFIDELRRQRARTTPLSTCRIRLGSGGQRSVCVARSNCRAPRSIRSTASTKKRLAA